MDLSQLIENRIQEAQRRGDFDNLEGAGKPLDLTPMSFEQRLYKTLFNKGDVVPIEVELLNKRAKLRDALAAATSSEERARLTADLASVQTELDLKLGTLKARKHGGAQRLRTVRGSR